MLIDTHAHLNLDPLYDRWRTVATDAFNEGITGMVVPGVDVLSSRRAIEMTTQEPRILASVGIHPENPDDDIDQLDMLARESSVVAIGEIGLDYFRFPHGSDHETIIKAQRLLFIHQLELARELNVPVLIHSRTELAMQDVVAAITSVYGSHEFRGIFHCFTGSLTFFDAISHWDTYIGIGGMITYPHQRTLQETIMRIPLERMVLETDAPLLTPHPFPKGVNTPGNVTISACKLAQLKMVPLMDVLEITGRNALRLFPQFQSL